MLAKLHFWKLNNFDTHNLSSHGYLISQNSRLFSVWKYFKEFLPFTVLSNCFKTDFLVNFASEITLITTLIVCLHMAIKTQGCSVCEMNNFIFCSQLFFTWPFGIPNLRIVQCVEVFQIFFIFLYYFLGTQNDLKQIFSKNALLKIEHSLSFVLYFVHGHSVS